MRLYRLGMFLMLLAVTSASPAAKPPPAVIVAEAHMQRLQDSIQALGTLRANEAVTLSATITDRISAIRFDDGDRVEQGQVLVEMTSAEERAQLAEAQATVAEARAQFERLQSLVKQGTAAQSLLDEQRRNLDTARARLQAIESRLQDHLIRAPFAGVVGLRNISLGALVKPGDVITTLDDDHRLKLEFPIPATRLASIAPGQPIVATTPAYGDRRFEGRVSSIDSRVDPVTRSVLVRAVIPNPERLLKPGLLMQVALQGRARDAVVIPESAILPLGRENFVLVVVDGESLHVERRAVTLGARRAGIVEVRDGLGVGERVVTQGAIKLRPGQPVRVRAVQQGDESLRDLLNTDDSAS